MRAAITAPKFLATPAAFRAWLAKNHASAGEIILGFYKKASGKRGLTYAEAVEEALCFGWIDSIARSIDEHHYSQRFSPRKSTSIWSLRNIAHVKRLTAAGRMTSAGLAAFEARTAAKTGVYSFEQRPKKFPAALEKIFRAERAAWTFWQAQPPGYQRVAIWWVISARQAATQRRRLDLLIALSAAGRRLAGK